MRTRRPARAQRCGFALLEILIVLLLMVVLVGGYLGLRGRSGGDEAEPRFPGEAQSLPGRAIQSGQSVECMSNLSQLRHAIYMETMERGTYPPALDRNWGVATQCPVSEYAYQYSLATGQVHCRTPGHEQY